MIDSDEDYQMLKTFDEWLLGNGTFARCMSPYRDDFAAIFMMEDLPGSTRSKQTSGASR